MYFEESDQTNQIQLNNSTKDIRLNPKHNPFVPPINDISQMVDAEAIYTTY